MAAASGAPTYSRPSPYSACSPILRSPPRRHGLLTGFWEDGPYASRGPVERATWLDRTVQSNAGIVRLDVHWALLAELSGPPIPRTPQAPPTTSRRSTPRCATL